MLASPAMALALAGLSFMLTVIWGQPLIRLLKRFDLAVPPPVEPGVPAMFGMPSLGGLLVVAPVALLTGLLNAAALLGYPALGQSILLPLAVLLAFALLGLVSDVRNVCGLIRLRPRTKLLIQVVLASLTAYALHNLLDVPEAYLPFYKGEFELGFWYLPAAVFVIVGAANAVSLTGGVDGLAGLIAATMFAAYGMIAVFQGQIYLARFCFTVTGALFGFLWFNIYPAALSLGNTGAYAIGAALAVVALMTGQWPLLPLIGIVPVAEALSVLLQVGYFRRTQGRRLFRMAPLHYHFLLSGWSGTHVVQRFWLLNILFAAIGIALAMV